jgi:tyrosyl-tRNA synthetase
MIFVIFDFVDSPDVVKKKLRAAFCEEGNVDENEVLAFVGAVLIPISQLRLSRQQSGKLEPGLGDQRPSISDDAPPRTVFTIERDAKFGGLSHYSLFEELKEEYKEKKVHPGDLKASVTSGINRLLEPHSVGI